MIQRDTGKSTMVRVGLTAVLFSLIAVFIGCNLPLPGNFEPTGTPFYLKSTVQMKSLVGSRTGANPSGLFGLDFTGVSLTTSTERETLPAGLLLRSLRTPVQHMLIARDQALAVPFNHDTLITLGTFCCNEQREVPSNTDSFAIGPVTDNTDLQQIVSITRRKLLNPSNVVLVQNAVWSVTDGSGLTQAMIDSLNALPDDTLPAARGDVRPVGPGYFRQAKEAARAAFRRWNSR